MKLLLKQKLKEQLQRTQDKQQETKKGRILCLEAIGELCRHGRIIYWEHT